MAGLITWLPVWVTAWNNGQERNALVRLEYWLCLKCDVTYAVYLRGAETLDSARSGFVLEWVDCCGEIVVGIFVRMEVREKDCWFI